VALIEDLAKIVFQEKELVLPRLDHEVAWRIGTHLRELAVARKHPVVIDVRRFGQVLFYSALAGTTPDNADWVRRKSNTVARFLRSSYAVGLELQQAKSTLADKYELSSSEYAAHGGSFPIIVAGVSVLGSVTVSGLPQRADHELVVEALCHETGRDYEALRLTAQA
jgi:uncharacterized protein (UPF0303 family)